MFLFTEMKYQLFGNLKRSVLTLCVSALLFCCMMFYLGNIRSNEAALNGLSEAVSVRVQVMSHDGKSNTGLNIDPYYHDALVSADVKNVKSCAVLAGAVSCDAKTQDMFLGGDIKVLAVNDVSAAKDVAGDEVVLADGWDISVLTEDKPVCLVNEAYAEGHDIDIGDQVSPTLYTVIFGMVTKYKSIGESPLEVVGKFTGGDRDLLVPIGWARAVSDEHAKGSFYYESLSAELSDPMKLNAFKAEMREKGFLEPDPGSTAGYFGDVLSVEDQQFVETAEKLQQNLQVFKSFTIPFFLLVVLLTTMTIFLTLRSSEREMAISCSLGSSKMRCFCVCFGSNMLINLIACGAIFPMLLCLTAISMKDIFFVCALYLICAAIGTAFALLFLLRFDILTQLTKSD